MFSKFILPFVWRKDPTLTPAWSLYPREFNGGWKKTPVSPYSSSEAGWTLHTHFPIFPRDERNQEGDVVPSSDTPAQEMPVGPSKAQSWNLASDSFLEGAKRRLSFMWPGENPAWCWVISWAELSWLLYILNRESLCHLEAIFLAADQQWLTWTLGADPAPFRND